MPSAARDSAASAQRADSTPPPVTPGALGSLRQDAISLHFSVRGMQVRMFPMDESVIGLLAPDSYRSLREQLAAQSARMDRARIASGQDRFSTWYVSFRALEPDVRFSPSEVVIRASGIDFRPLEIIPLSAGFGEQRIQQGQSQTAFYLFDPALDTTQPLEAAVEDVRSDGWSAVLRVLEQERARVRASRRDTSSTLPNLTP